MGTDLLCLVVMYTSVGAILQYYRHHGTQYLMSQALSVSHARIF